MQDIKIRYNYKSFYIFRPGRIARLLLEYVKPFLLEKIARNVNLKLSTIPAVGLF